MPWPRRSCDAPSQKAGASPRRVLNQTSHRDGVPPHFNRSRGRQSAHTKSGARNVHGYPLSAFPFYISAFRLAFRFPLSAFSYHPSAFRTPHSEFRTKLPFMVKNLWCVRLPLPPSGFSHSAFRFPLFAWLSAFRFSLFRFTLPHSHLNQADAGLAAPIEWAKYPCPSGARIFGKTRTALNFWKSPSGLTSL